MNVCGKGNALPCVFDWSYVLKSGEVFLLKIILSHTVWTQDVPIMFLSSLKLLKWTYCKRY